MASGFQFAVGTSIVHCCRVLADPVAQVEVPKARFLGFGPNTNFGGNNVGMIYLAWIVRNIPTPVTASPTTKAMIWTGSKPGWLPIPMMSANGVTSRITTPTPRQPAKQTGLREVAGLVFETMSVGALPTALANWGDTRRVACL